MTVLAIFALTQLLFFLAFLHTPEDYLAKVASWDGHFYTDIAAHGYGLAGSSSTSNGWSGTWAFYPMYPLLIRAASIVTNLSIQASGVLVSLGAGAAGIVILARALNARVGYRGALVVVTLVCTWPAAPVLQMVYTESIALLLLGTAFTLLLSERYAPLLLLVIVMSLTRPIAAPFSLVVAGHVVVRWSQLDRRERLHLSGLTLACALSAFLWPLLAGSLSGRWSIYFDAMAAFLPGARPSSWSSWAVSSGYLAVALMLTVVGLMIWFVLRMIPRACPVEMRIWVIAYVVYLLVASIPGGSIVRYLLLAFPLALAFVPLIRSCRPGRLPLGALVVTGLAGGVAWVTFFVDGRAAP